MKLASTAAWLGLLAPLAAGQYHLIGLGYLPYDPLCAESCLRSLTSYTLGCTPSMDMAGGHGGHSMSMTPPECFAADDAFLTSVAWCLHSKCADSGVPASKLESFWERFVTGSAGRLPAKWTYSEALAAVDPRPPSRQLGASDHELNVTSVVNPVVYLMQWNVLGAVVDESKTESKYSLVIILVAVASPILLTCLGYLPLVANLMDKIRPYLVYPSIIGTYQVRSLPYYLGNAPTVGQGLYLAVFFVLNLVLSAVDYSSRQPNMWFVSAWREINAYVLYRTGAFAFVLLSPLLLFSSRNNILLWLTDWSHSTFILLHRWIGRLFMLYAVVHSIIGLQIYANYATTVWWIWGAVATVAAVILTLASGLHVRTTQYELFLISHIVLAAFVVVGCWYHLFGWYVEMGLFPPYTSGFEIWLYLAIAIWAFDRAGRIGRVLKNGVRRARVTELGSGYVRVDIPGVHWDPAPGAHVYVHFPTLDRLRPWESHPFSVMQSARLPPPGSRRSSVTAVPVGRTVIDNMADEESQRIGGEIKSTALGHTSQRQDGSNVATATAAAGLTLFIKKGAGITRHLSPRDDLLALLDGPYYSNGRASDILRCDRVLVVAGGIGITGMLPWVYQHPNVKLAWSVAESARCLVEAVDLDVAAEKEVKIGSRFDVRELVTREAEAGWDRIGVVVAGPGSLCDDVRAAVAEAGRQRRTVFELEVDAYSW